MSSNWLKPSEIADLAGCSKRAVTKAISNGCKFRGSHLEVRSTVGNGGPQLEVAVDSLPDELRSKYWHKEGIDGAINIGVHPTETDNYIEMLEAAKAAPGKRKTPTDSELDQAMAKWHMATDKQRAKAEESLEAIVLVERLVTGGSRVDAAVQEVAAHLNCSASSIYKWRKKAAGWPKTHKLYVLLRGYGGGAEKIEFDEAAWSYIRTDYLRPEAPALTAVYERAVRQGSKQGWVLPSYKTTLRRINDLPQRTIVLAREGVEALERMYPAQERDKSVFHALEAVNADGHKFDVFVDWGDGEIGRPLMAAWQDVYSAKFLSYRVAKTENSDTIRLSFGDMIETYGVPKHAYLDNGRGFASKWLTGGMPNRYRFKVKEDEPAGILTKLGVNVHWCTPYHGQSKPIERAFRDLCETVAKHPALAGAYTGNNPTAKPENYGSRAVPIALFMEILDQEMAAHNAREGRRSKICNGRSFDQAFSASYLAANIQPATEHQKLFCMMTAEGVTPKRSSGEIHLLGNRFWSEELTEYRSQKVTVRFDPDNLHESVWVYSLKGDLICLAPCIAATGFNDSQAAREFARKRNQFKKAAKAQLKAMKDMAVLEAAIPNISVDQPEKIHVTFSKPIKQQQAAVIKEEQLETPRLIDRPVPEEKATPIDFSNRISGFLSEVVESVDRQPNNRNSAVRQAVKKLSKIEVE